MTAMSSEDQKRLDFFALETLVRCMLAGILHIEPRFEAGMVKSFEESIDQFRLTGTDPDNVAEFRDYMKQRGLQWIASACQRRPE